MYGVFATIFYDEEKVQLQSLWRGQYIFFNDYSIKLPYRNDTVSGHWIRVHHKEEINSNPSATATAAIVAAAGGAAWPAHQPTAAAVPSIGNPQAYY